MVDTVEQAIYRLRAEGQEQVDRLKASVDGLVVSEEKLDGTTRTSSQALQNRLARMDPLIRAQQQYQKELESAQRYIQSGVGSQAQQNAQIELATQRYNAQVTAIRAVEKATGAHVAASGLARHELINLSRQVQDVGVSLASGQSFGTVLIQQGTQIADVFASSTGSVRGFFSQTAGWAGTFLKSTGGIATAVLAIGGAAIYAASQFARASTTIEQALEEQNRLLKEGKALLDQRTSLEARAQLQSKEQTQFETRRNQLDLQVKLNAAMEEAARLAASKAGRPTGGGMPEMGIAPTGVGALSAPGYEKIIEAHEKLKAAQAASLPGIKEFNAELAKVGLAHPELALVVQDMIKAGEEGLKLEFAAQRAKAMSDALAGIATNAQLAAVGLGSIAQFQLNNREAEEAKESAERYAQAILKVAEAYPGMSIAAVKMVDSLNRQLEVAQAVGGMAQIEAQHRTRIVELSQRMEEADAARVAGLERAVALAKIEADHKQTMIALQGQLSVERQISDIGRINAQYQATVELLTLQLGRTKAIEQAQAQRAISIEQLAKSEERRRRAEEKAHDEAIRNIKSRTDAWAAYERGVLSWSVANEEAGKILRRTEAAAEESAAAFNRLAGSMFNAANAAVIAKTAFIPFSVANAGDAPGILAGTMGKNLFEGRSGGLTQFNPEGYKFTTETPQLQYAKTVYGSGGYDANFQPNATGITNLVNSYLAGNRTIATAGWAEGGGVMGAIEGLLAGRTTGGGVMFGGGGLSPDTLQVVQRLTELLPDDQKAGVIEREIAMLRAQPQNLETLAAIKQLTDSLTQLRQSTDTLADTMTDVLSPFYATDPRETHLGFRPFASGGIAMTETYARIAEREPEVVAPLSALPAMLRQAANSNDKSARPVTIKVENHFNGPVTKEVAELMKKTGYQNAQQARRMLSA